MVEYKVTTAEVIEVDAQIIANKWRGWVNIEIAKGYPYTNLIELKEKLDVLLTTMYKETLKDDGKYTTEQFQETIDKINKIGESVWENIDIPEDFEDEKEDTSNNTESTDEEAVKYEKK